MAADTTPSPVLKRRSWPKKLAILAGVALVLLVLLYITVSSSFFVKRVVLPQAGGAVKGEVTAERASFRPFSGITLGNVRVTTTGSEPLLTAGELRVRYRLLPLLRGRLELDELALISPVVHVVEQPDGTSNLDPLLEGDEESEIPDIVIRNVSLQDAIIRKTKVTAEGPTRPMELRDLDLSIDRLANGQPGKLTLSSDLLLANSQGAGITNSLEADLSAALAYSLDQNLIPTALTGDARLSVIQAAGALADLSNIGGILQADVTPEEIRQLTLQFQRGNDALGQVLVQGPLSLEKREGRLTVQVRSIDRSVLNLIGAAQGWDFGKTTINSTNLLDIARNGNLVTASGTVGADALSVTQGDASTPPLDLDFDYQVTINLADGTMVLQKLNLLGVQNRAELVRGSLDIPMNLTWGENVRGFTESTFQLAVSKLKLQDWRMLAGTNIPSGLLDLNLKVHAQQDGKRLNTLLSGAINDLAVTIGTNAVSGARLQFQLDGQIDEFKLLTLRECRFDLLDGDTVLARANSSARYQIPKQELSLELTSELALAGLTRLMPLPDLSVSTGVLKLSARVSQREAKLTAGGNLLLEQFRGTFGEYQFQDFQTAVDVSAELEQGRAQIHRASVTFRRGFESGGSLDLSGRYDITNQVGQFTFRAVDLNQNSLEPFLAPALGENKLVSISLNGKATVDYSAAERTSINGNIGIANWVVRDPKRTLPDTPLQVQLGIDTSYEDQVVDLRRLSVALSRTDRAANQLEVTGRVDLSETNASPSHLDVHAESLDLTPYVNLVGDSSSTERKPEAPAARQPGPAAPPASSEPVSLPVQDLTARLRIDRLFLREIALTNLVASNRIHRGEISLRPLEMTLNGAPVRAEGVVNLTVPGYAYDLALQADGVPIEPVANSFSPESAGQYKGDLYASVQMRGVGTSGASLRQSLGGQFKVNLTNLHWQIVGPKMAGLLEPIAAVLRLPELTQTPLNWIQATADAGQGAVKVQELMVRSPAFFAVGQGTVKLADVLTNSTLDIPISLSLSRSLAQKVKLVSSDAPAEPAYVDLPAFVTLAGTLGKPETRINKTAIAGLLLKSAGSIPQVGEKAGNVLQGLGNILSGQKPATADTNAPPNRTQSTNDTKTIKPRDLLDLIPRRSD